LLAPRCKVLVHDYSGHPFQLQLSRKLAERRLEVVHTYSRSFLTPHGAVGKGPSDPANFRISGIELASTVDKQSYLTRFFQERRYGHLLARQIRDFRPDVVISANAPLEAQVLALKASRSVGSTFIYWLQDLQGFAIDKLLAARLGALGKLVGAYYTRLEATLLRGSNAVVAISEDFVPSLLALNVSRTAISVIPNWASTQELPQRPKRNAWSRQHGVADEFCFLYSGTLGMKHNPELLAALAERYRDSPGVAVVVVSEGLGAQWLDRVRTERDLQRLVLLPFQPYAALPDVMGSADVLLTILEPDAGVFSVPSKVLSCMCAGRPLLLAVPPENLAARIVEKTGAGLVVSPTDKAAFLNAAEKLRSTSEIREEMGRNALRYAQETFDLDLIADRFEAVIQTALGGRENEAGTGVRGRGVHR
jgi:colanic acid biosynthesis glycosyl transferase WcaI